jgi:hypothetical protein
MVLAAPGLFSTTKVWPDCSPIFWATVLAKASEAPPGGKGTMTLTGLLGHVCAIAPKESAREKTAMNALPKDSEARIFFTGVTPFQCDQ